MINIRLFTLSVAVLLVIILILLGLKIFTAEDTWLCRNGKWVRHGNPASAPAGECK